MPFARLSLPRFLQLAAAAALLAASAAQAADYGDITSLLKAGQPAQAQVLVEQRLAATPKDPQLIFLRGVAQSESKQAKAAIETFNELIRDYPELPEPYNNLAVLYAQDNQLDKARVALEMAVRSNPRYATAQENLGDIYARLAAQAYHQALRLNASAGDGTQRKLALIQELFDTPGGAGAAPAKSSEAPAAALTTTAAAAGAAPAPAPASTAEHGSAAAAQPGAPAPDSQAVAKAIEAWAQAWSERDVPRFLGSYASDFVPESPLSRQAWEERKRTQIRNKSHIDVRLSDLQIALRGRQAVAQFHQAYQGDALQLQTRKELALVQQAGTWKIARESILR